MPAGPWVDDLIALAGVICFCLTVLVGYLIVRQDIERENWVKERRELLTRLQHPEIVPQGEAPAIPDENFMTAPADSQSFENMRKALLQEVLSIPIQNLNRGRKRYGFGARFRTASGIIRTRRRSCDH